MLQVTIEKRTLTIVGDLNSNQYNIRIRTKFLWKETKTVLSETVSKWYTFTRKWVALPQLNEQKENVI